MRAVNLIPPEERGGRLPARTGPLSYLVVGALVAALAAVTLLVLAENQVSDRKAEVAQLEQERDAEQARLDSLRSFAEFRSMEELRTATVTSLAQSRFDWERVMRELALVLPADVWLIELEGTVSPEVQVEDGADISLRESVPGPALELVGCTVSQEAVGRFVAALRDIDGVTRVTVASSERPELTETDSQGATGEEGGSADDCRTQDFITQFQIIAAFDEVETPAVATPPPVPSPPAPTGEESNAAGEPTSQEGVEQGVQEGRDAANLVPGA